MRKVRVGGLEWSEFEDFEAERIIGKKVGLRPVAAEPEYEAPSHGLHATQGARRREEVWLLVSVSVSVCGC